MSTIKFNLPSERVINAAPLRILVAEDNALIGMLLEQMLTTMGHEVCAVEATERATIASAARCQPDLVIADGVLREGSGISAVETILRSRSVAHIFVTGDHTAVRMRMPNAIILEKPFNEVSLEQAIRQVVRVSDAKQSVAPGEGKRKEGLLF